MKLDYTQLVERLSQRVDEMWEPEGQTKEQVASEFALPNVPRERGDVLVLGVKPCNHASIPSWFEPPALPPFLLPSLRVNQAWLFFWSFR